VTKAGFQAWFKELKVKSLVSGDRSARLMLDIDNPPDDLLSDLNRLQSPTEQVAVAIVSEDAEPSDSEQ
jgi:hypothetical protein